VQRLLACLPARTLEEVGTLLGVGRERVRQIEAAALDLLGEPVDESLPAAHAGGDMSAPHKPTFWQDPLVWLEQQLRTQAAVDVGADWVTWFFFFFLLLLFLALTALEVRYRRRRGRPPD
jgi:hypothetical protein